jgi:hypothetical protein
MAILAELTGVGETFYKLPDALSARRSSCRIGLWVRRAAAVSNFWLELITFTGYRSNRSNISISTVRTAVGCSIKPSLAYRNGDTFMEIASKILKGAMATLVVAAMTCAPGLARDKNETIDATAYGTSTQLGRNIGLTVIIYEFSTPEDRQILVDAFQAGQNQGLVNALQKMRAVGRIQIPGTLGYDLSFIRLIPTPTGRKIRFVTNRKITFGEAYANTQSQSFDLTAGEIDINEQDKSKSGGVLYPACQFVINKDGELQIELNQNAWRLSNIIDWKGTSEN